MVFTSIRTGICKSSFLDWGLNNPTGNAKHSATHNEHWWPKKSLKKDNRSIDNSLSSITSWTSSTKLLPLLTRASPTLYYSSWIAQYVCRNSVNWMKIFSKMTILVEKWKQSAQILLVFQFWLKCICKKDLPTLYIQVLFGQTGNVYSTYHLLCSHLWLMW